MKAYWEDLQEMELHVYVNNQERLAFAFEAGKPLFEADLKQAQEIQMWINRKVSEMEETQRNKLPIWKRIF